MASIARRPHESRQSSLTCAILPNRRRAASPASAGSIPRAISASISSSRWWRISASIELSKADDRTEPRSRRRTEVIDIGTSLRVLQNAGDGGRDPLPACRLLRQLLASGLGEPVVLGPPVVVRVAPRRLDPPLLLEPVQRRVERPLVDLEDIL